MLTSLLVVITYIQIMNHHVVHLKLLYVNCISKTNKNTSIYATDNLTGYRSQPKEIWTPYIYHRYIQKD